MTQDSGAPGTGPAQQHPPADHQPVDDRGPRRWVRAWSSLPVVVWVVGTAVCTYLSVVNSLTFFGAPLPDERARRASVWLVAAGACCLGAPLMGLVVARLVKSHRGTWLYALMTVVGALPWIGWLALQEHAEDSRPVPPAPYVCQEHSGGDTQCPGG